MWNILGEGPLARTDEADDQTLLFLFGGDEVDEGPLAWQERALCAQTDPEAFFPEKSGSTREAKTEAGKYKKNQQDIRQVSNISIVEIFKFEIFYT